MHKRLNEPKDEGVIKGVETVRSGAPDLPILAPWEPQQGPLILGDWLLIIEPIISDLSTSASVWWKTSVAAAESWYKAHMALSPLDRIRHKVETPEEVLQQKWERLERRVATMLLQALPQEVCGELVAARRLTTFGVITHLLAEFLRSRTCSEILKIVQRSRPSRMAQQLYVVGFVGDIEPKT